MSYGVGGTGVVPEAGTFVAPVAGTRIYLKRSEIKGKQPGYDDAEYGELFVNYHSDDPMLCFKDNGGNIVALKPAGPIGNGPMPPGSDNETGDLWWDGSNLLVWNGASWEVVGEQALGDLTDVDTTGAADGMVLAYDGSEWVPVSPASLAVDVDLGYTPAADKGTVTNTAGDDAEIPLANGTNAGLSLNDYTTAEKDKLAGIEDGAEANVGTDLGYTPAADKGTVTSSTGTDAEIPFATDAQAGLFQEAPTPDSGSVQYAREVDNAGDASWAPVEIPPGTLIDDGTGLPATPENGQLWFNTNDGRLYVYFEDVDGTKQWVDASPESAAPEVPDIPDLEWDNIQNKPDNLGLWEVQGSSLGPVDTTKNVAVGGGNCQLWTNGTGTFTSNILIGSTPENGAGTGVRIFSNSSGIIAAGAAGANTIFRGYLQGNSTTTSEIFADGSANFKGIVDINNAGEGESAWSLAMTNNDNRYGRPTIRAQNLGPGGDLFNGLGVDGSEVFTINNLGEAWFKGDVTSDGTIGFNLEPRNPDNYTTTTDSEGNEIRVYNGPTLDVKERVLNLIARLDAIEANEVIDDATDTSLLQLIASASSRLDSIEARLTALEGGN